MTTPPAAAPPAATPLDPSLYAALRRLATDPGARFVVGFGAGAGPALAGNLAFAGLVEELGLRPHVAEIWGVSAGAAIGGSWASGADAAGIAAGLAGLDRRGAVDVAWGEIARGLLRALRGGTLPSGLVSGRTFGAVLTAGLKCADFESCVTPFRCLAATDDGFARRKIFRRGPLAPAILRSMSIPGVLVPQPPDEEGVVYSDGAVVESTPLLSPLDEHARRFPDKRLVVACTRFRRAAPAAGSSSFLARMLRSMQALQTQLWERQLAEARSRGGATILVLEARFDDPELFDFGRLGEHRAAARAKFAADLQDGRISVLLGAG